MQPAISLECNTTIARRLHFLIASCAREIPRTQHNGTRNVLNEISRGAQWKEGRKKRNIRVGVLCVGGLEYKRVLRVVNLDGASGGS